MRKIKVKGESYLWKRSHLHLDTNEHSKCVEKITIYYEGCKKSPLRILFKEEDNLLIKDDLEKEKWCVGYPDDGVIWYYKSRADKQPQVDTVYINLNRPAVIAKLIEYFLDNGWNPKTDKKPCIVNEALKLLESIELPEGINNETES